MECGARLNSHKYQAKEPKAHTSLVIEKLVKVLKWEIIYEEQWYVEL